MKWSFLVLIASFILNSEQRSTAEDDHYVAAVVEYAVQSNTETNLNNYAQLVHDAADQNADIVVFPEMTLTRGQSVTVPFHGLLKEFPVPALHPELYHEVLVRMSEVARRTQTYVVINLEELVDCSDAPGEECPELKVYRFNTNVVFDRNGAVIDRYRKINLFGEFTRTPALKPDLGIFSTDFGVTFGHFICFDLMFQVPAVQVVQKYKITDVVFTTMWFSELPFLTAVEIQQAYAYSKDINFLASGANNPRIGSAGSGIYSGKAGALVSVMPGVSTTRLLVAKVPKVPGQVTPGTYPGPQPDDPAVQDGLTLKVDPSLRAHVSRLLVPGSQEFRLVDKDVSCKFRVNLKYRSAEKVPYFRAFVHDGINEYVRRVIGIASCAVVACADDQPSSCAYRYNADSANVMINVLEIVMDTTRPNYNETLKCDNIIYYPTNVRNNRFPLDFSNYTYSKDGASQNGEPLSQNGGRQKISLNLVAAQPDLAAFGIWGRIYNRDVDATKDITDEEREYYIEVENNILIFKD